MRRLIASGRVVIWLAVAAAMACSKDTTAPAVGTLYFKVDALTCSGTGTIEFFIDGTSRFTQTMSAGQTSQGTSVTAGSHTAGARETTVGGYVWPTQNVTVPANASYAAILTC